MDQENRDRELWEIAKKRATFKYHVLIYFIMNIFFWTLWYISLKNNPGAKVEINSIPWPVWPMLGWGLGVFFNYLTAYKNKDYFAEKEYKKLRDKTKV